MTDRKISKRMRKVPETINSVKWQLEKRKCESCKITYMGTKYQKWCGSCRERINNLDWDWILWT